MAAGASEEKTDKMDAGGAGASGGGSKLVLILTGVNMLVTVAMVAILFVSFQRDSKKAKVEDIAAQSGGHEAASGAAGAHGEAKEGEKGGAGAAGAKKKATEFGKMVTLDQFTVNLATPGSVTPKFLRVNMAVEVPTEDAENELNVKMPQVRNVVIDLINSKRQSDLATAEGRDYLKDEIKNALNAFMVTGKVRGVFFTNFAVTP